LQRDHGNRYVQGVISRAQAGGAGPPSRSSHPRSAVSGAAAGAVDASLQRAIEGARRGGRPLDQRTAAELGGTLGRDVSHVRVHDDDQADRLSRSLEAVAFTIGSDIFFRARHYTPGTTPGRRLLAHELAHVAQQEAGPRTAHRYRLAPAGGPGERAADRAADEMILGGRAQPMTMTPQVPLIQRRVFIGPDPISAGLAEFGDSPQEEFGGSPPEKEKIKEKEEEKKPRRRAEDLPQEVTSKMEFGGSPPEKEKIKEKGEKKKPRRRAEDVPREVTTRRVQIPYGFGDLGTGERHVARILVDYRSRYFRDINELHDYALRKTHDIGYVDREKVWVRLPAEFLVLGESHDRTTVMDLVEATGVEKYIYEGEATRPSPYLDPGQQIPEMKHQLEELLPKYVVALIGVEKKLARELKLVDLEWPGWKEEIREKRPKAERADPEARKREHQVELARWSSDWEAKHRTRKERAEWEAEYRNWVEGEWVSGALTAKVPSTEYKRSDKEVQVILRALRAIRDMTRGKNDPIALFYDQNRSVIDKTIKQLKDGLPIELTRMFLKMATGKFDLKVLITLLSDAAMQEFADVQFSSATMYQSYAPGKFTGHEAQAEELRDSYMLHRIIEAKANEYRLAGLGNAHRKRLQGVLQAMDPDIIAQSSDEFYAGQYRLHPDRD
jgi:hypothetical protein